MFVSQIFEEVSEILATTDQTKVFRKLSQAVQILMESGHYLRSQNEVDVCTGWDGVTVTLPRNIEVPLAVNVDGSPTYFRGRLFQYNVNKGGMYNTVGWCWDDRGYVATQMDIRQPSQLIAIAEHPADVGLQLRVLGTDSKNRDLRSQLDDGTGLDGILVPIHAQSDFPYGTIQPDGVTIQTRSVAISPISQFSSSTAHQLASGEAMVLSKGTGASNVPLDLTDGQTYYIGVDDPTTVSLYQTSLDAKAATNPINLTSIVGAPSATLTDSRTANVLTSVNLVNGQPPIALGSPNEVAFSKIGSSALPSPLVAGATYFAQSLDTTNFQVYASLNDANNLTNPVLLSGSNSQFNVDLRKDIAPQTTLTFYPSHNYQTGDAVQAYTNGGTLPTPLVAAQNYFVHSINSTSLTLHANASDATSGLNPITFTDSGSGASALVKLVPATSNTGTINQITAPGLNVTAPTPPTTAASAVAIVSGSVTSVQIVAAGSKYTSTPKVTFDSPLKTYSITGTTHSNKVIDGIYNVTNAAVGQTITGEGIPAGTIITAVNGSTSLVLSNSATTTSTATSFTGNITSLTHVVTNPSTLYGVAIGQPIRWSGLPAGTTIVSINNTGTLSTSTITISNEATTNGTGVTFTLGSLSFTIAPTIPIGSTQTYSTATGYAVMVPDATGSTTYAVGSIVITSSGQGYTSPPSITIDFPTTGNTFTYASTLGSPVLTTVTAISGQAAGQPVFGAGIPNGSVILSVTTSPNTITISQNATVTLDAGQPGSSLVAGTTNQAQGVATLQTSSVSSIIVPDGAGGSGYLAAPIVKITGGGGTGATATSQISSAGVVTGINVISAGTGYTSSPTIAFIPSTGVLVEFSSTGSLPSPIVAGTAYRLESPINSNTGVYTILNADYSTVNVTGTFSGNFYVNLSKAFAIGFNGIWNGDFNGLSTGQTVYLSSDYLLPTGVNNTTAYTLTKLTATTANLSAGSPLAVVTPTALGVGQGYFAVRVPGQGKPYNSLISLANVEYLSNGESVQFSSTGSLPAPLQSGTNYTITLAGNNVSLKTSPNASVTLTNLAVGQLSMDIIRAFAPVASASVVANNQIYDTGNEVMVRPNVGDTLPSGLSAGSYYVRAISPAAFELYYTQSNAENLSSTQGRITYSSTGNTVDSIFFVDAILPPTLVKAVLHVEKPLTVGYVSLYALDYGRSNDMALIGQYHPTEVNPKYRRIRVGSACSWVRIIYRALHPDISSIYDYIPVENARAVINAVHAVDLEDKDFFDQSRRYMELAIKYLKDQNDSFEGHAMMSIQVDGITYGDKTDPVIESGYGYGLW